MVLLQSENMVLAFDRSYEVNMPFELEVRVSERISFNHDGRKDLFGPTLDEDA